MVACPSEDGTEGTECNKADRPVDRIACNIEPCPAWNTGGWSEVSISVTQILNSYTDLLLTQQDAIHSIEKNSRVELIFLSSGNFSVVSNGMHLHYKNLMDKDDNIFPTSTIFLLKGWAILPTPHCNQLKSLMQPMFKI
jgi:hypothetical protein